MRQKWIILLNYEWANSTSDILWRRTKLGLRFNPEQITTLNHYIEYSKSAKSA